MLTDRTPAVLFVVLLTAVAVVGPASAGVVVAQSTTDAGALAQQGNATGNATGGTATVSVSATGTAQAQPDQAILRVSSIAVADNSSVAANRLARNVTQLRDALLAANLSEDQVRTVRYDLFRQEPERDRGPRAGGPNRTQFVARQTLEVRLNDTDRAGEIVDVAVANGATEVEDVTFTLSEATRRQLQQRALREAAADARGQAEAIAAAADLELAGVRSISTGGGGPVFEQERAAVTADAASAETTIESGPVTVTAQVTVTYNATATG
jgi:uncharacterized protein YggE